MQIEVISLSSLIQASNDRSRDVEEYLCSFICENNKLVETYLHNNAVTNEIADRSRTSLVIDKANNNEIIGYFSICIKPFDFIDVSGVLRKKLADNKKATVFTTILIAQLGRSDSYKGIISGTVILENALKNCQTVYEVSALRVVCVEYEDIPVLKSFYCSNGFLELQKNNNGYTIGYLSLG